jgi:hypothetical protein
MCGRVCKNGDRYKTGDENFSFDVPATNETVVFAASG